MRHRTRSTGGFRTVDPLAVKCLTERRYVDDLAPGAQTKEERQEQEDQSLELLGTIGLIVKWRGSL